MNRIKLLLGLGLLMVLSLPVWAEGSQPVKVWPDITNEIRLSNRDNNWVRCDQPITDVHYSEEKNVTVKIKGKNAYIKFLQTTDPNGEPEFERRRNEFIVNCSGRMYKILAWPRNIKSQTVLLFRGAEEQAEANLRALAPLSEDDRIAKLLVEVWSGKIPDSWEVRDVPLEVAVFDDLEARQTRVVKVDGPGYRVREYVLRSRKEGLRIREKDFLRIEFSKAPLAIALDPMLLNKGQTARLVIVESVNQERSLPLVMGAP